MKVLYIHVNPTDRPNFNEDDLWDQFLYATRSSESLPVEAQRVSKPTYESVTEALVEAQWDVIHLLTYSERREASNTALSLLDTDGRDRPFSSRRLMRWFAKKAPSAQLLVLQVLDSLTLNGANPREIIESGIPGAVCTFRLRGSSQRRFLSWLYCSLLGGSTISELRSSFKCTILGAQGLSPEAFCAAGDIRNLAQAPTAPLDSEGQETESVAPTLDSANHLVPRSPPKLDDKCVNEDYSSSTFARYAPMHSIKYDFFIAHASADAAIAEELYELLATRHRVFLDTKILMPGDVWDSEIPNAQRASDVTVVLISSKTSVAFYESDEIAEAIHLSRQLGSEHRVVPVYIDYVADNRVHLAADNRVDVPYGLRRIHSLFIPDLGSITELAHRLTSMLEVVRLRKV